MLTQLFSRCFSSSYKRQAAHIYADLVERSRAPQFFQPEAEGGMAVPDTLDGRFEMVLLEIFLLMRTLRMEENSSELQRQIAEAFFDDMDRSLREIGVGDTGVSHRIKKMAAAFYGRLKAYEEALAEGESAFAESLRRNVYGTLAEDTQPSDAAVQQLVIYVMEKAKANPIAQS